MTDEEQTTNKSTSLPEPPMLSAEFYAPWRQQQRRAHGQECARRVEQEAAQRRRSRSERRRQVCRTLVTTLIDALTGR